MPRLLFTAAYLLLPASLLVAISSSSRADISFQERVQIGLQLKQKCLAGEYNTCGTYVSYTHNGHWPTELANARALAQGLCDSSSNLQYYKQHYNSSAELVTDAKPAVCQALAYSYEYSDPKN